MTTPGQLTITMVGTIPTGTVDLMAYPYDLHADTQANQATIWRKKEVTNPHVEGSYLVHAERENIVEDVYVWVEPDTRAEMKPALDKLRTLFGQVTYTLTFTVEGQTQIWDCQAAEYTIDSKLEFLHADIALFQAKVPRLPRTR